MLMENFVILRIYNAYLFGMYFKKDVFEFFGMSLLQKQSDALVNKQIRFFHLESTKIGDARKCSDIIFS